MHETIVPGPHSLNRPAPLQPGGRPKSYNALESKRKTEDFRDVRSRLRKTSSRSPSKPLVKSSPEPQPVRGRAFGIGHHSPPAKLETTKTATDKPVPPAQDDNKTVETKGKEREITKSVPAKVDHNLCIEDHKPAKPPKIPVDHNKCLDEPREHTQVQPAPSATETSRDHVHHSPREDVRAPKPHSANKASIDHECEWKDKYMTLQADVDAQGRPGDIGLEGLTIVLHMQGRDDLVINTDLRNLQ